MRQVATFSQLLAISTVPLPSIFLSIFINNYDSLYFQYSVIRLVRIVHRDALAADYELICLSGFLPINTDQRYLLYPNVRTIFQDN